MKPKMWPREAQESFLGETSSLEIQDEAQDVAKRGSRKLSWPRDFKMKPKMRPREAHESFLGEISSLEISR